MAAAPEGRSLGELFADLSREVGELVRSEIALARAEVGEKTARAMRHVAVLAAAAVLLLAGAFTLIAAAVLVLVRLGMPAWGAALTVGFGLAALGVLAGLRGLTALRTANLAPTVTIQTLKDTARWARRAS